MEYLERTWEHPRTIDKEFGLLDRSRNTILNTGYKYFVFKSKAKKFAHSLKSQIVLLFTKS